MSATYQGYGTAVVAGGGPAGLVAAWVLREWADEVMVIEHDRLPHIPAWRPGTPQASHAHLLLEAGHRSLEELMPGIVAELLAAGGIRVVMGRDLRWLTAAGRMAPHQSMISILSLTRPLLEHVLRARVASDPRIRIIDGTTVVGLLGNEHTVAGVRIRGRGDKATVDVPAELVVDASGRGGSVTRWLQQLGCAPVPEQRVDAGCVYSSRLISDVVMPGVGAMYVQTTAARPVTGSLLPVERDRWIVSLGGMRNHQPGQGEAGFQALLSQLRDPVMREVVLAAEPVTDTDVAWFPAGPSVRRDLRHVPDGLVGLGKAGPYDPNPVYGQGMAISFRGAQALGAALARYGGIGPAAVRAARRDIMAAGSDAWMMSTAEDSRFPATIGAPRGPIVRGQHRFLDQVLHRATRDPRVAAAFTAVMSLIAPPAALFRPRIVAPVLLGIG